MMRIMAATLALVLLNAPAQAETRLGKFLLKEPALKLRSAKSPTALELCIGLGLSDHGVPSALRGERETVLASYMTDAGFVITIKYAVTLVGDSTGTDVILRSRSGKIDDDDAAKFRACV